MVQVSQDIGAHITEKLGIEPQSLGSATTDGTGFSRMPQGEEGAESGVLYVRVGAAGAITSVNAVIQHSTDDAAADPYTTLTDNDGNNVAITAITAVNNQARVAFNAENAKLFLRVQLVTVATAVLVQATVVLGGAIKVPPTGL